MQKLDSEITLELVHELVDVCVDEKVSRRLDYVYNQVPPNNCQRCVDCCFNCAQVYPIEFLNISSALMELPELDQARLGKRMVEYELIHLTSLEVACPFLEEIECVIYQSRPLQCRVFGLYPEHEYAGMVKKSRDANEQLAMHYARTKRVLLPEDVMTHDVDQCENNIDDEGRATVLAGFERENLHKQVFSLGDQILPEEWFSENQVSFSSQYASFFFEGDELEEARIDVIKEYQAGKTRSKLDRLLSSRKFHF